MLRNKEGQNPIDLMLESINKIGDKSLVYTREELEIAVTGEALGSEDPENLALITSP